ncbi:MAG: hypothetical protein ACI4J4_01425 [Ruminiclostridium sp.]
MRFIATDLKRIFSEPAFYISLALNFLLLMGGMAFAAANGESSRLFLCSQSFALPFVAPLLAAMPYSVMIMQEKETRYSTLMSIKSGAAGYEMKRLFTCGISGAAALFLPQLLLYCICIFMGGISDFAYDLKVLLLSLTFGFSYAVISYGLTFVNRHNYVPLVMPQVLYMLCIYAFPILKLEKYYPPLDIAPTIYGGEITAERFIIPLCLTALGFVLTLSGKAGNRR